MSDTTEPVCDLSNLRARAESLGERVAKWRRDNTDNQAACDGIAFAIVKTAWPALRPILEGDEFLFVNSFQGGGEVTKLYLMPDVEPCALVVGDHPRLYRGEALTRLLRAYHVDDIVGPVLRALEAWERDTAEDCFSETTRAYLAMRQALGLGAPGDDFDLRATAIKEAAE